MFDIQCSWNYKAINYFQKGNAIKILISDCFWIIPGTYQD